MEDRDLIINQIRQRLEILYQAVEDLQNGEDPGENYYTKAQINALLLGKVDVVAGKGLSTNDYTNIDKAAVASIADISYNLGVLESVVDGLFDPLDETVAQGGEVSSAQKADIREQKPISLNGNVYYFVKDNGTSYIYCSYDNTNSQLLIAAVGKSNWLVNFTSKSLGGAVTGVKGNAESTYRTGNVNITKANIGLGNVDNTSDMNKPLSTAAKTYIDNANEAQDETINELNTAEAEDRAALIGQVDSGAKNLVNVDLEAIKSINTAGTWAGNVYTRYNIEFTINADNTVSARTINGSATSGASLAMPCKSLSGGTHILTGCPAGSNGGLNFDLRWGSSGTYRDFGDGRKISVTGSNNVYARVNTGIDVPTPVVYKPMMCTAADHAISPAFVPYVPTNRELYEMILALQSGQSTNRLTQSLNSPLMLNREEITPLETDEIEERGEINGTSTDWQNE